MPLIQGNRQAFVMPHWRVRRLFAEPARSSRIPPRNLRRLHLGHLSRVFAWRYLNRFQLRTPLPTMRRSARIAALATRRMRATSRPLFEVARVTNFAGKIRWRHYSRTGREAENFRHTTVRLNWTTN
jgi:hypothetical protein